MRPVDAAGSIQLDAAGLSTWREVLRDGLIEWPKASARYLLRLGPLMVAAGLVSGFVVQWLSADVVERFLGDDAAGIVVAATFGILINVPLLFEIPLVAALLLVGMGTAPAATLLFTAAAGGPFTFWGLAKVLPKRAIVVFAAATWALGALGGLAVLGLGPLTTAPPLAGMQVRSSVADSLDPILDDTGSALTSAAAGAATFTDITDAAGLVYLQDTLRPNGSCLLGNMCAPERQTGGAAAADYDNDGYIDIYVTRLNAPDMLFRNLGNGRFENRAREAGLHEFDLRSNGAVWFDPDNDGDLDLYVTTIADTRFYLFINDGQGRFTEEAVGRGAAVATAYQHLGYSVAVGDYDRDGWLDLHVNEWGSSLLMDGLPSHARLLRNRGSQAPGHFEDVTVEAGVALEDIQSQLDRDPISPSLEAPRGAVRVCLDLRRSRLRRLAGPCDCVRQRPLQAVLEQRRRNVHRRYAERAGWHRQEWHGLHLRRTMTATAIWTGSSRPSMRMSTCAKASTAISARRPETGSTEMRAGGCSRTSPIRSECGTADGGGARCSSITTTTAI